ncbi:MAG TPA: chloride channel protein, partial [Acidobacteriaceae bacterium]|nr:chloride channel protein [Acidobacteriaceae bacterium]
QWVSTGQSGLLSIAAAGMPPWRRAITPAVGGLAALAVTSLSRPLLKNSKFKEYIEAVRLHNGRLSFHSTFWRTISSSVSIATGAAVGREGSMIQFAAAATSHVGQRWKQLRLPLAQQVACGVAAAVAAAYQAPIAGIFFALEIVIDQDARQDIASLLVASVSGAWVSRAILGAGPLFAVRQPVKLDVRDAWLIFSIAVLMGLLGPLYYWLNRSLKLSRKVRFPLFWSGALVGMLSLLTTQVWGNGDAALLSLLQSTPAIPELLLILLCRLCATTVCVGTGTIGGIFTPTLFVGSVLGMLAGHWTHASSPLPFAILGMGCLLSSVTHAPLMATFMTVELTGQWQLLPLALLSNLIAWQLAAQISPHALYALASPTPTAPLPENRPEPAGGAPERRARCPFGSAAPQVEPVP